MGTRRQARLNSFLVRELSGFIREIKIADLGFVTITRAIISPDLHEARVYVSVFGDEHEQRRNLETLERARGFLRSRLGAVLGTRVVPNLLFLRDEQVAGADEMAQLIAAARASDPDRGQTPEKNASPDRGENSPGDFPPPPANLA